MTNYFSRYQKSFSSSGCRFRLELDEPSTDSVDGFSE